MSKVIRSVKNVTKGYSTVQVKVREATSNDAWGPTGTQMSEIAQLSFNGSTEFYEIVDMLDKRLNDKGKNWRHVLKALKVLDYCLHEGSESVVTWARQNVYIIKTLREFQYVDEEGRDVGNNVRVAAKELTSLLLDEERLRAERDDRKTWKSRVMGIEEFGPPPGEASSSAAAPPRRRDRQRGADDSEDAEYRLAIEASLNQEEEDRKKRESRNGGDQTDADLERALQLSKEEEDARKQREIDSTTASSLFDNTPTPTQTMPQATGFNQGYTQGTAVDFFANPVDQSQQQPQQTGYMGNMYTGFQQPQPTGFPNGYGMQGNPAGFDPYAQQQQQQQQMMQQQQQPLVQQATSFNNPYGQQMQPQQQLEQPPQPGSNNPWATGNNNMAPPSQSIPPVPTGSNNPFASSSPFRPQQTTMSSLGSLPEQQPVATFNQQNSSFTQPQQPQIAQQPQQPQQPQKELSEHEAKLNALLAGGDGQDTFGNTGNLRIPAQHTAPGTFVNSAGANLNRLNADATGNNPFLRNQFTGVPQATYGGSQMPTATGPAGINGFGGQQQSNPFAARQQQQQQNQGGDLIQL